MEQFYGLTAEMYRAVVALVDDRMKEIRVTRQHFDRLVKALARTEEQLKELVAAQARTEAELQEYRRQSEERFARIEAALGRLTEAQARTEEEFREYRRQSEERFARIEATLERLAEAQAHTEARVRELTEAQARMEVAIQELRDAQARTEAQVRELAEAQARTEAQLQDLIRVVDRMNDVLSDVRGKQLELTYQRRAAAYFGPLLRRLRVLSPVDIEDDLEAHLSAEEFRDLVEVDLLVTGQPRRMPEAPQVWLAVEVSAVIDRHDVERARRRAALLRRAGLRAIPAVAGERITAGAREEALAQNVLVIQDGRASFWEEALAEALNPAPAGSAA